jgi:hypothetical protein
MDARVPGLPDPNPAVTGMSASLMEIFRNGPPAAGQELGALHRNSFLNPVTRPMDHKLHDILDGSRSRDELSLEEAEALAEFEAAIDSLVQPLLSVQAPDLSGRVLARVAALESPASPIERVRVAACEALGWIWRPRALTIQLRPAYAMASLVWRSSSSSWHWEVRHPRRNHRRRCAPPPLLTALRGFTCSSDWKPRALPVSRWPGALPAGGLNTN